MKTDRSSRPDIAFYGFRGGKGGISHVMLNLINATCREGLRVDVLLNRTDIPELAHLDPEVRQVPLGDRDGLSRLLSLAKYLRSDKPSALLTNRERANFTAVFAKRLAGAETRLTFRAGMPISTALARRNPLKRWIRRSKMVHAYQFAHTVIANSEKVALDVLSVTGIAPERVHAINNPTVAPEILRLAEEPLEHPWFTREQIPVITAIGRLARQKDFPVLLRAFAQMRPHRSARLIILGEGNERADLERLARELGIGGDLDLPGFVANPFAYLARSALFVLSSAWEGSPNVLIEAMATGTPVVATDCPSGPREILAGGHYGPLVPVGDVDRLAEAMLKTLDNPPSRDTLREGADRYRADLCTRAYLKAMGLISGAA